MTRNEACDAVVCAQREYMITESDFDVAHHAMLTAESLRAAAKQKLDDARVRLVEKLDFEATVDQYAPPDPYAAHIEQLREAERNIQNLQEEARAAFERARKAKEVIESKKLYTNSQVMDG